MKSRISVIGLLAIMAMLIVSVVPVLAHVGSGTSLELTTPGDTGFVNNTVASGANGIDILWHDSNDGNPTASATVRNLAQGSGSDFVVLLNRTSDHFTGAFTVVADQAGVLASAAAASQLATTTNDTTTTLSVDDGTPYRQGMKIKVGTEIMRVTQVNTNTLTVVRAVDATVATGYADNTLVDVITAVVGADSNQIRVTSGSRVAVAVVDATQPTITNQSPADNTHTAAGNVQFAVTISDAGVGLGADADEVKAQVSLTIGPNAIGVPDAVTSLGGGQWRATWNMFLSADAHPWSVTVSDLVDNTNDDMVGDEFLLTIDQTPPTIQTVKTGVGWNSGDKETETNRKAIMVTFQDGLSGNPDFLAAGSLQAEDFRVAGVVPQSVVYPNLPVGEGANVEGATGPGGLGAETRNIAFLIMANDFVSNATPLVEVSASQLTDLSGNPNNTLSQTALDGIGPSFTVTITGTAGGSGTRPLIQGTADSKVTIRVASDESLTQAPVLSIFNLDSAPVVTPGTITTVALSAVSGATNTWQANLDPGLPDGLVGVHVHGTDLASPANKAQTRGTSGLAAGDTILGSTTIVLGTLASSNLLFEIDNTVDDAPVITLLPQVAAGETESQSPFVRIVFDEDVEYTIPGAVNGTVTETISGSQVTTRVDSHRNITLTAITLDGADVMGNIGRIDDKSFTLATTGLAIGEHELEFDYTDTAGNAGSFSFTFEVLERSAYEVDLSPGWNLVSLPGRPAVDGINSVFPASHPASSVLAYINGEWQLASRPSAGQPFEGSLTTISGSVAYWVQTGAFTPITTLIPERDPASDLPSMQLRAGWNLVPVVDLKLSPAGGAPGGGAAVMASSYFASIPWVVAYTYETQTNTWTRITALQDAAVVNGAGYWVYVLRDSVLVP